MTPTLTILQGDWIEQLKTLPDESVHCVVTSPPYWNLRDYGVSGTTGAVALELGRNAVLIELNHEYVKLAKKRTFVTPGLPL